MPGAISVHKGAKLMVSTLRHDIQWAPEKTGVHLLFGPFGSAHKPLEYSRNVLTPSQLSIFEATVEFA